MQSLSPRLASEKTKHLVFEWPVLVITIKKCNCKVSVSQKASLFKCFFLFKNILQLKPPCWQQGSTLWCAPRPTPRISLHPVSVVHLLMNLFFRIQPTSDIFSWYFALQDPQTIASFWALPSWRLFCCEKRVRKPQGPPHACYNMVTLLTLKRSSWKFGI